MLDEIRCGPIYTGDGGVNPARAEKSGCMVTADGHARYQEAVYRGNVFCASTQAGVATTVSISTTATGIILTNPPGSGKILVVLDLIYAFTAAPAGAAPIALQAVIPALTTETTHTTPLTVRSCLVGSSTVPAVGKADSSSTLAATPVIIRSCPGGVLAGSGITPAYCRDEIAGMIQLTPGSAIATMSLTTAIAAIWSIFWEEIAW